jgi:hypothetical protein
MIVELEGISDDFTLFNTTRGGKFSQSLDGLRRKCISASIRRHSYSPPSVHSQGWLTLPALLLTWQVVVVFIGSFRCWGTVQEFLSNLMLNQQIMAETPRFVNDFAAQLRPICR